MVAWYEGVSERLRKEAEDEDRERRMEAQQAEVRRLRAKTEDTDDEASVDSRGPALAYFRNPLYRHVDGRPTIVRRGSKRPTLSPRPTMMDKGKDAATTVGHVIRNIGSPHLWDGRHPSKSHSRERDHRRRRSSVPDNTYREAPTSAGYDSALSPGVDRHRRRRSAQLEMPPDAPPEDEEWHEGGGGTPVASPRPPSNRNRYSDDRDATLRHSRSHEPTPSQKEYPDYFHGFDDSSRRNSAVESPSPAVSANGIGPSFGPSQSPLFASHVAKQPQPQPPRPPPGEQWGPSRRHPPGRRPQGRPYSRSPDPSSRYRDDRRYSSRDRRRYDQSPGPMYDDMSPPPPGDDLGRRGSGPPGGYGPLPHRERRSGSGRLSGSDLSYSGPDERDRDRRSSRPGKQTRFAAGVDGRRYPNETPWR
jgi:hypothetical protein